MVDQNNTNKPGVNADADAARTRLKEEQQAAGREFDKGRDAVMDEASRLARSAQDEAYAQGEALKGQAADGLHTFADAVRSARDELEKKNMGPVSGLVGQAAEGLEGLSRSLQDTSATEMLDSVREFGRRNPVSFIAASVLAGIAIGRFAGASARHNHTPRRSPSYPAPRAQTAGSPAPRSYPAGESAVTPTTTGDLT